MQHQFESRLGWQNGISTEHEVNLELGLEIADFLKGKDIATTLQGEQETIRGEVHRIVMEEIVPKIFKDAGAKPVPGALKTNTKYETKTHARMIERQSSRGVDVEIFDELSIALDISTDRPVTALEAIHGSGNAVGDAITNDVMMHLAHKYLGITNHSINSEANVKNGKVVHYEAKHVDASSDKE